MDVTSDVGPALVPLCVELCCAEVILLALKRRVCSKTQLLGSKGGRILLKKKVIGKDSIQLSCAKMSSQAWKLLGRKQIAVKA